MGAEAFCYLRTVLLEATDGSVSVPGRDTNCLCLAARPTTHSDHVARLKLRAGATAVDSTLAEKLARQVRDVGRPLAARESDQMLDL